jgi:hypothetical protein
MHYIKMFTMSELCSSDIINDFVSWKEPTITQCIRAVSYEFRFGGYI